MLARVKRERLCSPCRMRSRIVLLEDNVTWLLLNKWLHYGSQNFVSVSLGIQISLHNNDPRFHMTAYISPDHDATAYKWLNLLNTI